MDDNTKSKEQLIKELEDLRKENQSLKSHLDGVLPEHAFDVTERKRAEEILRISEEKFSKVFLSSPDSITITNLKTGKLIEANQGFENIFGLSRQESIGKNTPDLNVYADKEGRKTFVDLLNKQGFVRNLELRGRRKSGEIFNGLLSAEIIDISGERYIVTFVRDITERKNFETELLKAKEKAEEADRLKTAFLHNISHEIRTPMNAIIGFSALLSEPNLTAEMQNSYIDVVIKSSDHLLAIVNDIVEVSNIEAGILKINKNVFNLNSVLYNLYRQFKSTASEKRLEFKYYFGLSDDESNIHSDGTKLIQILSNLLSNAFKFTRKGEVNFGYKMKGGLLEFYVSDTGIGIPAEQHLRIFDRFYQVENSSSREYEGTGLGLSITKAYVELLGGKIWLKSENKKGSAFYFTLPYEKGIQYGKLQNSVMEINSNPSVKKTLLIAEDDNSSFTLMKELLSGYNIEILRAENGAEAVEICKSGRHIDLVLMDIKMPEMDGFAATRQILKHLPGMKIIAQTAYADDEEKVLKEGFKGFISKPFTGNRFQALVKENLWSA